jgi:hypothetical protein
MVMDANITTFVSFISKKLKQLNISFLGWKILIWSDIFHTPYSKTRLFSHNQISPIRWTNLFLLL